MPSFPATDGAAYNVFPLPFESPSDGDRELVTNAADPDASPFGWHDTNGVAGPGVHPDPRQQRPRLRRPRQQQRGRPRNRSRRRPEPSPSTSRSTSAQRPFDSQPAIVTNLFYWNNIVHDLAYGYGFDEAAGNFQVNNYGKGGLGNDDVRAEAQDGSGRNNANFGTPVDGQRPRMQMFEWRSSAPNPITVAAPSPIAGTYYGPMAGFGESLVTTGPITRRGGATSDDGCDPAYQDGLPLEPYLAVPAGKIALIDRGVCTFVAKVKKAQDAGAVTVIVANNIAGPPTRAWAAPIPRSRSPR